MTVRAAQSVARAFARRSGSSRLIVLLMIGGAIVAMFAGLVLTGLRWAGYQYVIVPGLLGGDGPVSWNNLDWTVKYDGYGEVDFGPDIASLKPRAAQNPGETSAALAVAGDPAWRDYSFTVRMNLQQQLRQNSPPNPWEAGWLFFRYQSDERSYYMVHKPNGLEIGKLVRPMIEGQSVGGNQVFLATKPDPPAEPGRWYDYRIDVRGPTIQVYVDDELQIAYTDPDPILNGRVGLYTEDAYVLFQDPVVHELPSTDEGALASGGV